MLVVLLQPRNMVVHGGRLMLQTVEKISWPRGCSSNLSDHNVTGTHHVEEVVVGQVQQVVVIALHEPHAVLAHCTSRNQRSEVGRSIAPFHAMTRSPFRAELPVELNLGQAAVSKR